ncbi:YbhB/YbcL family Raf kinase inhibitor-like protein [Mucilaginibacter robiniae]|uniref:YbhB/YbcL family Raf kinase inhibitor-like protein n=1 Tax=Mucilaginibacter robiniae TaxID=2728022 RepID=A0A7L5E1I0_9SPHI|nr:YbhB/YbcL family Raf kinase inhibitor-like protein [Mucilaginibacter robiniae]QJD97222.1 YbhB/YbcL family Raf kinase inhibitor-like protein [Mucilaginibacter robiniae]
MKTARFLLLLCWVIGLSSTLQAQTFTLQSPDIQGQFTTGYLSNTFGCQGGNTSPALKWSTPPAKTLSYALTMFDPDAPTGSGWWHWVVFDIPASATGLPKNAGNVSHHLLPEGSVQSITDFGIPGYGGLCPPEGDRPHGYIITLYALDTIKLGLDSKATPALVGFMLNKHVVAKTSLIVYSKR